MVQHIAGKATFEVLIEEEDASQACKRKGHCGRVPHQAGGSGGNPGCEGGNFGLLGPNLRWGDWGEEAPGAQGSNRASEEEANQLVALVVQELKEESPSGAMPDPVKALKVKQLIENLPTTVPEGFDKVEEAIEILTKLSL